ncbi:uncharacterized protein [Rutidosis leptorrhynchoides]|uniref:uncharacterized protein n=1 Tax=Rutidosis leptorrhynchoides TaxID=125765 RepID=UPI003A9A3B9E
MSSSFCVLPILPMKILSVNIRGFKRDGKADWFKRMIASSSPIVAAVQETKCKKINDAWIEYLWGSQSVEYAVKYAVAIVNVYGPYSDEKKKRFWESLDSLCSFDNLAWVFCGDFNEVRSASEREHTNFVHRRASLFNDFIHSNGLIDVPLLGKKYTRISDDGVQFSKLDRFLVSTSFAHMWNDLYVSALDWKLSDHTPLLLQNGQVDYGPKPF